MRFTHFRIRNFKGIKDETLDFRRSISSKVFSLVGLNESGKTTILEAINYFAYKPETLKDIGFDKYEVEDIHNLIPINQRDNFNDSISITAGLELNDGDITSIKNIILKNLDIVLTECGKKITYTQKYYFKNSIHQEEKDEFLWTYNLAGRKKRGKKIYRLENTDALMANNYIKENLPSILYFPNFLFEFPEKIYLEDSISDKKHKFYQSIFQDLLDSLDNDTNIQEHIIDRVLSEESNDKRNLTSLVGKMSKKLSDVVFNSWDEIFKKKISKKEILLDADKDEKGVYIEFLIKDNIDTYQLSERSLGFRWFFVYVLLTQFRSYRRTKKNAFFLFDEPASNLHPSAQSELLRSFENLPNVIYTTHSHYLINPKWLENTYVIKNRGIDYQKEDQYSSRNTDISIMKYREFVSKFPSQTSYFQPILEVLEYRPSNIEIVPKVVLTEGKNDYYTFMYYQTVVKGYKRLLRFTPGVSSSNLINLITLYIGWGAKFVVLLDSDEEGLKQKERYINECGDFLTDKIFTYQDIGESWIDFETEDLFSKGNQLQIQKAIFFDSEKYKKKLFNSSIVEQYVIGRKSKIDSETEENFKIAMEFLRRKLK